MRRMKKELSILFTLIFAFQAIAGSASAATFYVDDNGNGNYTTIQAALVNASGGDTIIVEPGSYPGDINIKVQDLSIVSSSPYDAVISATGNAFILNADNIKIQDFNIIGSGSSSGYSGIVDSSSFCTIQNNKISNFNTGIEISRDNKEGSGSILNNDISDCGKGISLRSTNNNKLSGNKISNCLYTFTND